MNKAAWSCSLIPICPLIGDANQVPTCYVWDWAVPIDKYYLSSVTLSLEDAATCSTPPWWTSPSHLFSPATSVPSYHRPLHATQTRSPGRCFSRDCFRTSPNEVEEVAAHDYARKTDNDPRTFERFRV